MKSKIWLKLLLLVFVFGGQLHLFAQITISGKISDSATGEDLLFATVYIKGTTMGTTSNEYGFYSLTVEESDLHNNMATIIVSYVGYDILEKEIHKGEDIKWNPKLTSASNQLEEVVVLATKSKLKEELKSTEMSTTRIQMKDVMNLPSIGGEVDLVKIIQLLPGVTSGTQGSTGMFVRGGAADQNLVLLDEATVYNLGHLFGFFSVFNSDAIKDVTMIKGAFPANRGGRLSSILDVRMREGDNSKFHGSGGIGLLSSRFTFEGPIIKEKVSFLVSGRRTYIDQVMKAVGLSVPYYFYDFNAKLNYKYNDNNRIFYSMYLGDDILSIDEKDGDENGGFGVDFGFKLGNITNTLRWNHIYNSKIFSNVSLITTSFKYDIKGKFEDNNIFIGSSITDIGAKIDFDYFKTQRNHIKFGGQLINHRFNPNVIATSGEISESLKDNNPIILNSQEIAIYGSSDYDFTDKIKINYGLRVSGSFVKDNQYFGLEPRLAIRYSVKENDAIKMSYSRMKQYLHRVSSSSVSLPTDLWYPVTNNIKPQVSDQIALGYSHLFSKANISFSLEGYYKKMKNLIEFKEGTNLILNDKFEGELLQGEGNSFGAEVLIKKDNGRLTGWMSYTISKSTRLFQELNNNESFPSKYDRRHNIAIVTNFELSKRWLISAVWVYQSGAKFTAQIGQYFEPGPSFNTLEVRPIYTSRNEVSMSPSHRLDINITLKGRETKRFKGDLSIGGYNIYNYAQPYKVKRELSSFGGYKYTQPGLFGFIPSISYNFRF